MNENNILGFNQSELKADYTIQILNHVYHFDDYELYDYYKDSLIYHIWRWFHRYNCDYIKEPWRIKYLPLFYDLNGTIKEIPELFDDIKDVMDVIDGNVDIYVNHNMLTMWFEPLFIADIEHVLYICKEKRLINVEKNKKMTDIFTVS